MPTMLRQLLGLLLATAALTACETRRPPAGEVANAHPARLTDTVPANPTGAPAAPDYAAVVADTPPFPGWDYHFDTLKAPSVVQLNGQTYTIRTAARADSSQPLTFTYPRNATSDSTDTERGVQVYYTVALHDAQRRVFVRQFIKQDFEPAINRYFTTGAYPFPPQYLGHWPRANALAFRVRMLPDGSDYGEYALLLLDAATGRTRQLTRENWSGGASADTPATLAPDGKVLLLGYQLRYADGTQKSLNRKGYDVAGSRLINDSTILVAYEPAEVEEGQYQAPSAQIVLLNRQGRQLKTWTFDAANQELGYSLRYQYLFPTRTHYFYDQQTRTLLLVPRDAPLQARVVRLAALPKFRPPRRPTEVQFEFWKEDGSRLTLWVDTVGGVIRLERWKA